MMRSVLWLTLMATMGSGCIALKEKRGELDRTLEHLTRVQNMFGAQCAPEAYANARSAAQLAEQAFELGLATTASDAADEAAHWTRVAAEQIADCSASDRDRDRIPDAVDQCPDEPEDKDGDRDEDGCRDLDPAGDEDHDGIRNIDDHCVDEPEDRDGHNDDDGCPESSEDSDGDGLVDAADQCPDQPEDRDNFRDGDGCPDEDNDGDGILDVEDNCPGAAEDPDSWEDEDGCPEPDNDLDGIGDFDDDCPDEYGTFNNHGCPGNAPGAMAASGGGSTGWQNKQITLKNTVTLGTAQGTLSSRSKTALGELVNLMNTTPNLRVLIQAHTDTSVGGEDAQMALTQAQAEEVKAWLVGQGIDPSRLTTQAAGASKPVDTNRTAAGRANNRRVEFYRL